MCGDISKGKEEKMRRIWVWVILVIVCLPAMWPLLRGDFFHFSDENQIANLYQMVRGFESGQLPPRWAPDFSYGYGYPFFNYFYPLPHYLGSWFFLLSGSLITALKWVFLIGIPISAILMYEWVTRQSGKWAGWAAAVIYVYTPYRAVDLYVRGAVGEALCFMFLPLVGLAVWWVFEKANFWRVGVLAVSVAGLILCHNLIPLIFLPWVSLYALVLALQQKSGRGFFRFVAGVLLGLAMSSFFWFPAFWERGLLTGQTPFNYIDHFPFIRQLVVPYWGYGASNPGPGDDMSFQVGVVNWLMIIGGGVAVVGGILKKVKVRWTWLVLFLGGVAGYLFLMNIRSSFLWEAFLLSAYVQFPWRMLTMTTFLTAGMIVVWPRKFAGRRIILGVMAVAAVVLTVGYFRPSEYFGPGDDYFLNRFFSDRTLVGVRPVVSREYDLVSEDYLILPVWVKERPKALPFAKIVGGEGVRVEKIEEMNAVWWRARVAASEAGMVIVNNYYFPGWEVMVDGERVEAEVLSPYGNMGVRVSEGEHEVEVRWEETRTRKIADAVSVLAGVFLIGGMVIFRRCDRKE